MATGVGPVEWLTVDRVGLDVDRTLNTVLDMLREQQKARSKSNADESRQLSG